MSPAKSCVFLDASYVGEPSGNASNLLDTNGNPDARSNRSWTVFGELQVRF